jgi:hypothetical protein
MYQLKGYVTNLNKRVIIEAWRGIGRNLSHPVSR